MVLQPFHQSYIEFHCINCTCHQAVVKDPLIYLQNKLHQCWRSTDNITFWNVRPPIFLSLLSARLTFWSFLLPSKTPLGNIQDDFLMLDLSARFGKYEIHTLSIPSDVHEAWRLLHSKTSQLDGNALQ